MNVYIIEIVTITTETIAKNFMSFFYDYLDQSRINLLHFMYVTSRH